MEPLEMQKRRYRHNATIIPMLSSKHCLVLTSTTPSLEHRASRYGN